MLSRCPAPEHIVARPNIAGSRGAAAPLAAGGNLTLGQLPSLPFLAALLLFCLVLAKGGTALAFEPEAAPGNDDESVEAWLAPYVAIGAGAGELLDFLGHVPSEGLDPAWAPLLGRLEQDGFDGAKLRALFSRLGPKSYTPAYMAAKITELYGVPGIGINRDVVPEPKTPPGYGAPVPDATVGSCLDFIKTHTGALKDIKEKHGVGANTVLGILLVETGLGLDTGKHIALRALASMALTDTPEMLALMGNQSQAKRLSGTRLAATLREKSAWAYTEVKALLRQGDAHGDDLALLPGSIYGAVGLCQFMPSNIEPFGVDGDQDGRVDLFSPVDAMYSAANYLEAHGWRGASSPEKKRAVILTYNRDNIYAAVVMGTANLLARALDGKVPRGRYVIAGGGRVPSARLDPSLRRLRPVPRKARVQSLGDYKNLLQ